MEIEIFGKCKSAFKIARSFFKFGTLERELNRG